MLAECSVKFDHTNHSFFSPFSYQLGKIVRFQLHLPITIEHELYHLLQTIISMEHSFDNPTAETPKI